MLHSPGHKVVGSVHAKHIYEIALAKQKDKTMADLKLEVIARSIASQASSMGIQVVGMGDEA